jgi:hypothetical protein
MHLCGTTDDFLNEEVDFFYYFSTYHKSHPTYDSSMSHGGRGASYQSSNNSPQSIQTSSQRYKIE